MILLLKRFLALCLGITLAWPALASTLDFTVLREDYASLEKESNSTIAQWIAQFLQQAGGSPDERVAFLLESMEDKPYLSGDPKGEGRACADGRLHCDESARVHIQQNPLYRTDGFNCQTLVEMVLSLLHARDYNSFQKIIRKVSYGGAGPQYGVHFYNRNHFPSLDFNPVNEINGYLENVTDEKRLGLPVMQHTVTIDKAAWFAALRLPARRAQVVQVRSAEEGPAMLLRLKANYPAPFVHFSPKVLSFAYVPTAAFFEKTHPKQVNLAAIEKLPTPAVLEVVRDPAKWFIGGKPIAELIGSPLHVSHMGILYRKHFQFHEKIADAMSLNKNLLGKRSVVLNAIFCQQKLGCDEVMFAQASNAFPSDFHFYRDQFGRAHCQALSSKNLAKHAGEQTSLIACNRVYAQPFYAYLAQQRDGRLLIRTPSILGFHVEAIK